MKISGVLSYITEHSLKKYSNKLLSSVLLLRLSQNYSGYISTNHPKKYLNMLRGWAVLEKASAL